MTQRPDSETRDVYPTVSRGELVIQTVVTGAVSSIPIFGGFLGTAFGELLNKGITARQERWLMGLSAQVDTLLEQKNGLTVSEIVEDELFVDAVLELSASAVRTSDQAKLDFLKYAVVSSIGVDRAASDLHKMLLRYLDELSTSHLSLLLMLDDPRAFYTSRHLNWPDLMTGSLATLVEGAFRNWSMDFAHQLNRDIYARGLVNAETLQGCMNGASLSACRTTALGKQLLRLVGLVC